MSYHLSLLTEAQLDLKEAYSWYLARNQEIASEFIAGIGNCLLLIQDNPLAYPIIYKQVRRAIVSRFPYTILYLFEDKTITVIACFHSKRDPRRWQSRI
jgi:plasmid stabilization system protein ParE